MENLIRFHRQKMGVSQLRLAEAVGTTRIQIYRLENGQRRLTVDWMGRIARALGLKTSDLLPREAQSDRFDEPGREIIDILSQLHDRDQRMLVRIAQELLKALHRQDAQPAAKLAAGEKRLRGAFGT